MRKHAQTAESHPFIPKADQPLSALTIHCDERIPDQADVNFKDVDGETALIKASGWGGVEKVNALLAVEGIDVNLGNNKGDTALIFGII